jgi:polynucleotide 5'-kinase involved in rRNA processing
VRDRSREDRAANRQRNFGAYFRGGREVTLDWGEAPVENSGWTSGEPLPGHMLAHAEECVACEVLHGERHAEGVFLIVEGRPDPNGLRELGGSFGGRALVVAQVSLRNLLVGLLDEEGGTLALAILEKVDFRERRMGLYTGLADESAVRGVRLGSIQLARDGTQLGTADLSGE